MEENMDKMNKMIITVTNRDMTIKCNTTDEIKDYIKKSDKGEVEVYDYKRCVTYKFRTVHHPDIYKAGKNTIIIYIDGIVDEWNVNLVDNVPSYFTRNEIEELIPYINEALNMLADKVDNKKLYIIEF